MATDGHLDVPCKPGEDTFSELFRPIAGTRSDVRPEGLLRLMEERLGSGPDDAVVLVTVAASPPAPVRVRVAGEIIRP